MKKKLFGILALCLSLTGSVYGASIKTPAHLTVTTAEDSYVLKFDNTERSFKNVTQAAFEVDVMSNCSLWSSGRGKVLTKPYDTAETISITIPQDELKGFADDEATGYKFRVRYDFSGQESAFSSEVSIGSFPSFKNASPWAREALYVAQDLHIIPQTALNDMTRSVTREELAEMLVKTAEIAGLGRAHGHDSLYTDAATDYPSQAQALGIMTGYGPQYFAAASPLTREDMAVSTARLLGDKLQGSAVVGDSNLASPYAKDAIGKVVSAGLMSESGSVFNPKGTVSVQEALLVMVRLYDGYQIK
ncbi:S-layer homology domain-containing protein [Peptoniphilus equinus]|uniref:S-layer homology domain-containing protein n=1 Tax=Peptoniphilus equinus TaxID=3016343 RepID=A0ABY7QU57_9FIRM|nr:S-layer homology domain-containing protein [Peptoniphilus equinus]WBW50316.1 S-layer homology domain-containing protein [Peptoniphilus equinus]